MSLQINSAKKAFGRWYVSATPENTEKIVVLMIVAKNFETEEEVLIDAILPDDGLATVLVLIRQVLGEGWTLQETIEIEPPVVLGVA